MKKLNFFFLISLIIFMIFIITSLFGSSPTPTTEVINPPPPTKSNTCIITVNAQKYDVTQYQFQHSGGSIFTCGTDMSAIFASQHPSSYLNKMHQYLVK